MKPEVFCSLCSKDNAAAANQALRKHRLVQPKRIVIGIAVGIIGMIPELWKLGRAGPGPGTIKLGKIMNE